MERNQDSTDTFNSPVVSTLSSVYGWCYNYFDISNTLLWPLFRQPHVFQRYEISCEVCCAAAPSVETRCNSVAHRNVKMSLAIKLPKNNGILNKIHSSNPVYKSSMISRMISTDPYENDKTYLVMDHKQCHINLLPISIKSNSSHVLHQLNCIPSFHSIDSPQDFKIKSTQFYSYNPKLMLDINNHSRVFLKFPDPERKIQSCPFRCLKKQSKFQNHPLSTTTRHTPSINLSLSYSIPTTDAPTPINSMKFNFTNSCNLLINSPFKPKLNWTLPPKLRLKDDPVSHDGFQIAIHSLLDMPDDQRTVTLIDLIIIIIKSMVTLDTQNQIKSEISRNRQQVRLAIIRHHNCSKLLSQNCASSPSNIKKGSELFKNHYKFAHNTDVYIN